MCASSGESIQDRQQHNTPPSGEELWETEALGEPMLLGMREGSVGPMPNAARRSSAAPRDAKSPFHPSLAPRFFCYQSIIVFILLWFF